jgi:hypothetical protein
MRDVEGHYPDAGFSRHFFRHERTIKQLTLSVGIRKIRIEREKMPPFPSGKWGISLVYA